MEGFFGLEMRMLFKTMILFISVRFCLSMTVIYIFVLENMMGILSKLICKRASILKSCISLKLKSIILTLNMLLT